MAEIIAHIDILNAIQADEDNLDEMVEAHDLELLATAEGEERELRHLLDWY